MKAMCRSRRTALHKFLPLTSPVCAVGEEILRTAFIDGICEGDTVYEESDLGLLREGKRIDSCN
jgi:hypothetical protein